MLNLTRRKNESLFLELADDVDPSTPVGEVFPEPIEIVIKKIFKSQVTVGNRAPAEISIFRKELLDEG